MVYSGSIRCHLVCSNADVLWDPQPTNASFKPNRWGMHDELTDCAGNSAGSGCRRDDCGLCAAHEVEQEVAMGTHVVCFFAPGRELFCRDRRASPLLQDYDLIRLPSRKGFFLSAWPLHFQPLIAGIVSKPDVHTGIILRNKTRSRLN